MGKPVNVTSVDGVRAKYSNAEAFEAGMLGIPNDDPVDTLTVKAAPAGALFCDNVMALVMPPAAGRVAVPLWVIGIEML